MSGKNRKPKIRPCGLCLLLLLSPACYAASLQELEAANAKGQWNDAAEISYEQVAANPTNVQARLQGAYALFQKGYANSALLWLKPLKPADWRSVPQGADRFVEIISLFQKKVPLTLLPGRLDQISLDQASPYLYDEIRFAKGRQAFERGDMNGVKANLQAIAKGSRYFAQAHYLLGAAAVKTGDYKTAMAEFTRIFEPEVLDQSTEFWRDMGTQMTTHWGANLKVALDAQSVRDLEKVGELALLGMARVAYATGQYDQALRYYSRVSPASVFYPAASLERVWTLLALNRHDDAQKAAAELSVNGQSFQSIEARTVRALILTDAGRTDEAKAELDSFFKAYTAAKAALQKYETTQVASTLPAFLKNDLQSDLRLKSLNDYQDALAKEAGALRKEDPSLFPVYAELANRLEPLSLEAKDSSAMLIENHVVRREADLETLYVQAKLITAEVYLENRQKLRLQYRGIPITDAAKQAEHDRKLVELLQNAVDTVDEVLPRVKKNKIRLEFRQSELLWELSGARGIVAQTTHDKSEQVLANELKLRSLKIAEKIARNYPDFEQHAEAMFVTGYTQIEVGRIAEGTKTLQEYVVQTPRDTHVPDAYRILADMKFDANEFSAAEALYEKILAHPDSPVVGYALYKIGWCAYNLKDFAKALLGLEKAVRWAAGGPQNQLLSLKRESRHDLISVYAEVGDYRKALDYFSRFFQGDTTGWISDLASELDRTGQYEKSAYLYTTLIALEPGSSADIVRQADIIDGKYHLHDWDGVLEETRKLTRDYGPQLQDPHPEGQPAAVAEKVVRTATLAQLYEYQKDPSADEIPRVTGLDGLYLSNFGKWPASEEPLYRHGYFLLARGNYPEAASVFRKHWTQFKSTLTEPKREESLRNLIYALDKSADVSVTGPELLQYTADYQGTYPKTKYARAIRFLRSTVYFRQGKTEDGIKESQALFDENPADDIGKRAFKNLRVAYYDLKDWKRTYEWAGAQLASKAPGMKLYTDELQTVRMEALFQWADQTHEDAASAALFLQVAHDPSMARLREKAYYDAFIRYHKAGRETSALDVANELQKAAPDFESLQEISGVRAALYQEAGDYAHAYPLLVSFVKNPGDQAKDPSVVQKAKMNLALIAEALGKSDEARTRYAGVLKSAPADSAMAKEARRAIQRLDGVPRDPTQLPPPEWNAWEKLQKARMQLEKHPIPARGELAERIKRGGESLEKTAALFADASTAQSTPAYYAFEAYCSLPFLYSAYSDAVSKLPGQLPDLKDSERKELQGALTKVTDPIQLKIRELADQCVSRSADSRHDGPQYRAVLERWGWRSDPALRQRADQILAGLKAPGWWLDPVDPRFQKQNQEDAILKAHLEHRGSDDSWYALARLRWARNNSALSRLTLVDALALYPNSGKILNALGAIDRDPAVFEAASQKGSPSAWANLALYHLKAGRLTEAERDLEQGLARNAFDRDPVLKKEIQELVKK